MTQPTSARETPAAPPLRPHPPPPPGQGAAALFFDFGPGVEKRPGLAEVSANLGRLWDSAASLVEVEPGAGALRVWGKAAGAPGAEAQNAVKLNAAGFGLAERVRAQIHGGGGGLDEVGRPLLLIPSTALGDGLTPWLERSPGTPVYLCAADAEDSLRRARRAAEEARRAGVIPRLLVFLAPGRRPRGADLLARKVGAPLGGIVRAAPADIAVPEHPEAGRMRQHRFGFQFRTLAREIAGRRLGLALSSGSAKGFAHLGVIQALEENGIEIDLVSGASMGAYVGACWAAGNGALQLGRLAAPMGTLRGFLGMIDPVFPPRRGAMLGNRIEQVLRRSIGGARFEDLSVPLRVVATDFDSLERVVFRTGDVASAVHASISMPGIFAPVKRGRRTYIDGGVADPLPVKVLREAGVERVIAVSTIPTHEHHRQWSARERRERGGGGGGGSLCRRAFGFLRSRVNYFAYGNVFDTIVRSFEGMQARLAERDALRADVVIQPLRYGSRWHEFNKPAPYIALGKRAAEKHLGAIRACIKGGGGSR